MCLYRLFSRVSHPVSSNNFSFEQDFVAPVTIRIASVWIFSISVISVFVQLSHTVSAYSRIGLIKDVYFVCKVLLSSWNFKVLNKFTLFNALQVMSLMWSLQVHLLLIVTPRCLCESTCFICTLFINSAGWRGGIVFLEMTNSSVLLGLNLTNQSLDQLCTLCKSLFSRSAARVGLSTTNRI